MIRFSTRIDAANRSARKAWWGLQVIAVTLCLSIAGMLPVRGQQPTIDREAKIKAAYLYQFIRYVQWPENAFEDPTSPIVIGTVGDDAVNRYVRVIAGNRMAGNRRLVHQHVQTADQARACHIMFVSDSIDPTSVRAIIQNLRDAPVLLVGEDRAFVESGGVIAFMLVNNNVRLQLSMKSAAQHRLKISSQLAKLAELVN